MSRVLRHILKPKKRGKADTFDIGPTIAESKEQVEQYDEYQQKCHGKRGEVMRDRLVDCINLSYQAPIKVLDCGTGTADIAIRVASRYPKSTVYGLDASGGLLRIAKEKITKQKLQSRIKLIKADLRDGIPSEVGIVDAVVSQYVFHYKFNRVSLFKLIRNALKNGGKLVFGINIPLLDDRLNQKWWQETQRNCFSWYRQHRYGEKTARKRVRAYLKFLERYAAAHCTKDPVDKWLSDLRKASFRNPECVWRDCSDVILQAVK